jgi:hypothetical protein
MIGHRVLRLRLGLSLVVLSWLPLAQACIWITDAGDETAGRVRVTIWTSQLVIGFVGLLVAGPAAKSVVKTVGWRRLPGVLWSMLRTGSVHTG